MDKYVRVEDVMSFINTSNRGNSDYFIVDQIEDLCKNKAKTLEELKTLEEKKTFEEFTKKFNLDFGKSLKNEEELNIENAQDDVDR